MRAAAVGHVEWIEFGRVDHVPEPGEIVHVATPGRSRQAAQRWPQCSSASSPEQPRSTPRSATTRSDTGPSAAWSRWVYGWRPPPRPSAARLCPHRPRGRADYHRDRRQARPERRGSPGLGRPSHDRRRVLSRRATSRRCARHAGLARWYRRCAASRRSLQLGLSSMRWWRARMTRASATRTATSILRHGTSCEPRGRTAAATKCKAGAAVAGTLPRARSGPRFLWRRRQLRLWPHVWAGRGQPIAEAVVLAPRLRSGVPDRQRSLPGAAVRAGLVARVGDRADRGSTSRAPERASSATSWGQP